MNALILLGSLRADSINALLAREIARLMPEGTTATVYEGLGELPHYSEDLDTTDGLPHAVASFRAAVAEADAIVVVTPEYNGAVSSAIKNAVDWASRPFGQGAIKGQPTVVFAATGSRNAGAWARENAVRMLAVAGADVLPDTVGIGTAQKVFASGALTDPKLIAQVRQALAQLPQSVNA